MSRLIRVAMGLVLLLAAGQWVLPQVLSSRIAGALASYDHGARPVVRVTAIPFWELAQGKFQNVYISAHHVRAGPLILASAVMQWQNGQISIADLVHRRIRVLKAGRLKVGIRVSDQDLSHYVNQSGRGTVHKVQVHVAPGGVVVSGIVQFGKTQVPLTMHGHLGMAANRRAVLFYPQTVDGLKIPVATQMTVFQLADLPMPVRMVLTSLHPLQGGIRVNAASTATNAHGIPL